MIPARRWMEGTKMHIYSVTFRKQPDDDEEEEVEEEEDTKKEQKKNQSPLFLTVGQAENL